MLSFLTLFSLDICNWTSEKDLGELINSNLIRKKQSGMATEKTRQVYYE